MYPAFLAVIACDKREAFAQGVPATKQSCLPSNLDCFAEPVIGRCPAEPLARN